MPDAAPEPAPDFALESALARAEGSPRSRAFFVRGLKTLLPTLITLYLIVWVWDFLWDNVGRHLIWLLQNVQYQLARGTLPWGQVRRYWMNDRGDEWQWWAQVVGVSLVVMIVYFVGLLVGNLIGRTFWRLGENLALRIPVVRAIYPAAKQITDFVLYERNATVADDRRVVACRPHSNGVWSIGLVTGNGMRVLEAASGEELLTVFVPSSPTAFSGYVLVVPRSQVVELPLKVEEALKILVSGGVLTAKADAADNATRA